MSYIEVKKVFKSFDGRPVLKNINMCIEKGEFATLLGSSGCGKTTLLRCLIGLEKIDSGEIYIDKKNMAGVPPGNRGIGMIFQQYCLFPTMTVYNNISFGLRMQKLPKEQTDKKVKHVLEMLGLKGHENKYPYQLSGGEQQRVSIGRSVVMEPKVLFLDEPFSAIDAKMRKELQIYLKEIHTELNMTSVFVTHDQEEAMRMSDRIYLFHDGILEQSGSPKDIYAYPKTAYVAGFIGSYNIFDSEDFNSIFKSGFAQNGKIAVRPEAFRVSGEYPSNIDENFIVKSRISSVMLQGNIVRYSINTGSLKISADRIFSLNEDLKVGEEVFLSVKKKDVIFFG